MGVGAAVGGGVLVGTAVGRGRGVGVAVGSGVGVGSGVAVGTGVGVAVGSGVGVGTGVAGALENSPVPEGATTSRDVCPSGMASGEASVGAGARVGNSLGASVAMGGGAMGWATPAPGGASTGSVVCPSPPQAPRAITATALTSARANSLGRREALSLIRFPIHNLISI